MGLEISHVVDTALGNEEAQCWFTTQVHAKSTSRERSETAGHPKMVGGKRKQALSTEKAKARVRSEHLQDVSVTTGVERRGWWVTDCVHRCLF